MAEIQHGLVQHIDDEEELSWPEVTSHPKHDAKIKSARRLGGCSQDATHKPKVNKLFTMKWLPTLAELFLYASSLLQR